MYEPVQIPYLLSQTFSKYVNYREHTLPELQDFVICFWEMSPVTTSQQQIPNVIVIDGCIDLVVDFSGQQLGFSGMAATDFAFVVEMPAVYFGARLKAGAFRQLTGLAATMAMDQFLPLNQVFEDFDEAGFFAASLPEAKIRFQEYLTAKFSGQPVQPMVRLFDQLYADLPASVSAFAQQTGYSPRQLQRICLKNYGLPPKTILSILRFQKSLRRLLGQKQPTDSFVGYYDQPHFNHDFKEKIGITPRELMALYQA